MSEEISLCFRAGKKESVSKCVRGGWEGERERERVEEEIGGKC
jgi:hypothetical protein